MDLGSAAKMEYNDPIKLLMVGDDSFVDSVAEALDGRDVSVLSAGSPLAAMKTIASQRFHSVLCDGNIGQPVIEFVTSLRGAGYDTPVILLTQNGDEAVDDDVLQDHGVEVLPMVLVTPELLWRTIRFSITTTDGKQLLQSVLDASEAGIVLVNEDGKPAIWNPAFAMLAQMMIGNGTETIDEFADYAIAYNMPELILGERVFERHVSRLRDGVTVLVLTDVTERIRTQEERREADRRVAYLAHHDNLTGLPNRTAFANRLHAEVRKADLFHSGFWVLAMDLNKFKEVNDVFGHAVGDELLAQLAECLGSCLKDDEYLARFGGDEFVALQRFSEDDTDVPDLAKRLVAAADRPFTIEGNFVRTGVSIGASVYPDHGTEPEQLLANADSAMYRAKGSPQEKISVFDETLDQAIRERRALAANLKDAVASGDLDIFFQPQAMVDDWSVFGFEALARWNHPHLGWVPPSTFIPIAEENGLIIKLGELVLSRACELASTWPVPHAVAVNVSAVQIGHSDLAAVVRSALSQSGLPPERLELEITETVLIEDPDRALTVLEQLKDIGVSIAMDDFGTGYSSLSSLLSFPFDKIKIDRSFIDGIDGNRQAVEIIRAVLGLGRNLRFSVIAEGVETEAHVQFLRDEGCREMQGYLIGKPVSAAETDFQIRDSAGVVLPAGPSSSASAAQPARVLKATG